MKIAISGYTGPVRTGIGRNFENIFKEILKKKTKLEFVLFRNSDEYDFTVEAKNVTEKRFAVSRTSPLGNVFWHLFIYPIRVMLINADVSFIPNVTFLLWKTRPTVVIIHDLIEFNVPQKFSAMRMLYRKIAVPWTARMADMIITISHASKKDIVQRFKIPKEKVKVVYCGVDERFGRVNNASIMEVKKKYNVPDNYILFVGTVDHPGKNVLGLIMSCERLWRHKKMHNKLVLVGKKGYRYETILDYISINNLQEYIIHLGYVDDSDLPAIYSGAKLFCFLSYYEGFGLPVLEAMASGVPVIVSNRSSLPEIVSDAGKVVEIEKLQEISDAIMTILENHQLWKELSKMGKLRAEEFNWNSAGEKTIKVFEKMLES